MNVSDEAIEHIKRWEGLRLEAYPDPGSKNGEPWTIGYGHTSDDFLRVTRGLVITQEQADAALAYDIREAIEKIGALVTVPLTENQLGALVSFVFNVGPAAFARSTLLKRLNAGDYNAVPVQLAKWVYNDGKKMPGLVNRRAAEAGLWARGAFVTSRNVEAGGSPVIERLLKPEAVASAGGLLTAAGGVMSGDGPVQYALAAVLVVAAIAVAVIIVRRSRA